MRFLPDRGAVYGPPRNTGGQIAAGLLRRLPGRDKVQVIVMGAGVVGVTTAWYLQQAGHEVTVLERNAQAACETSFGNGGQISVSHFRSLSGADGLAHGSA